MNCQFKVTIVVCTYRRADILSGMLHSLTEVNFPEIGQTEIVIVDNNSDDHTRDVFDSFVPRFAQRGNILFRYVLERSPGLSNARNRAIMEAGGAIVAFTDDDVELDKNWLIELVEVFRETKCAAVGGRVVPVYPSHHCPAWIRNNRGTLAGPIVSHEYGEETRAYTDDMLPFIGANMAFRREALEAVGSFRTDLGRTKDGTGSGEDTEMFRRVKKSGAEIVYAGKAVVKHPVPPDRCSFRYIARWQISHGENYAPALDPGVAMIGGVPRWVYRKLCGSFLWIFIHVFHPEKRLGHLLEFLRNIGIYREYRRRQMHSSFGDSKPS